MNVAPDQVGAAYSQLLDQIDDEPSRPDISVIRLWAVQNRLKSLPRNKLKKYSGFGTTSATVEGSERRIESVHQSIQEGVDDHEELGINHGGTGSAGGFLGESRPG